MWPLEFLQYTTNNAMLLYHQKCYIWCNSTKIGARLWY